MGLGKLFGQGAGEVVDKVVSSVGEVVDKVSTSDEEKLRLKNDLSNIVIDGLGDLAEAQRDVIIQEMKGNWLQRSWRPLVMLTFAVICVIATFTEVKLNVVPDKFWNLLMVGIGGYVGGRSLEKISENVTKNSDLTFLKKKDRKE